MTTNTKIKFIFIFSIFIIFSFLIYANGDTVVYITRTGAKYHRGSCSYLRKSKIPVSLSDAINNQYTPCSRCNPPMLSSKIKTPSSPVQTKPLNNTSINKIYHVNTENIESYKDINIEKLTPAKIVSVFDGTTFYVKISKPPTNFKKFETIRLIGLFEPTINITAKEKKKGLITPFEYIETELLNQTVYLAFDNKLRDDYNNLFAYTYIEDGTCFNANMLNEGYASVYTEYNFQFLAEFLKLEIESKENKSGLWNINN